MWDDNSPITSADVAFTWQAYLKAKVVASGYDQIDSVDASDPHTAVIRFKVPFADWPDLFGGSQGHVLKKAAFPDGPDVASEMQTSLPFSGMPWKLQTFSKDQAVLVPNTNYWVPADIPMLDKVTFVAGTGQDTEINSLMAGDLAGIYPQASPGLAARLSVANVKYRIGGGASFEGIWPNLSKPPLDDPKVRQALFMSIDRNEILNTFIKPDVPDATVLNCGGWVPTLGEWCDNAQFADIKYDPAGAKTILQADGWALGPDGVFAKGGQRLDLELNTVAGNSRREGLEQVIMRQAAKAGFAFHPKNYSRPELTEDVLPHGRFGIAIYSQAARSDPSVTSLFSCDQIPSVANQFTGTNYSHWCDAAVSGLMKRSDQEVSPVRHVVLIHQVGRAIRDGYVWLPFYQLPVIAAYRTDKVAGPVEDFTLSSYTNFWNINKWHLP